MKVIWALLILIGSASAATISIAPADTGSANGTNCANAHGVTWFSSSSPVNQTAGNTYFFCNGTYSYANGANGIVLRISGTSAVAPNILQCESSATIFTAGYSSLSNGLLTTTNKNFWHITGPCLFQNTDNGTNLGNQQKSQGIVLGTSHDIEIDTITMSNLYVHTANSNDQFPGADDASWIYANGFGANISIHDLTCHDAPDCIQLLGPGASVVGGANLSILRINCYNTDHCVNVGLKNVDLTGFTMCGNHFHDAANWDTVSDFYHHDAYHIYANKGSPAGTGNITGGVACNNIVDGDWGFNNTAAFYFEGTRSGFQLVGNFFTTTNAAGFNLGCGDVFGTNFVVVNNTCIGPHNVAGVGWTMSALSQATGYVFQNNLTDYVTRAISNSDAALLGSGATWTSNRYGTNLGTSPWQWGGLSYANLALFQAACPTCETSGSSTATVAVNAVTGAATAAMPGINLTSFSYAGWSADQAGTSRGSFGTYGQGAYEFIPAVPPFTGYASCAGTGNASFDTTTHTITGTCTAGVTACSAGSLVANTCQASYSAGANDTVTFTATSGQVTSVVGGSNANPCVLTNVQSDFGCTATVTVTPGCTLTFAANSINAPSLATPTTIFTGLSGPNSFWFIFGPPPDNTPIYNCSYPFSGCTANGQTGNIIPVGSGLYTGGACSNGVCCTGSTAPLNINNIGIGGITH